MENVEGSTTNVSSGDQPLIWESMANIIGEEAMLLVKARSELNEDMDKVTAFYHQLAATRKYYKSQKLCLLDTFRKSKYLWAGSYPMDWSTIFSPIEYDAWCSIRSKGRMVLYPQYPILQFHADFANPALKIVLELDGKQYHDSAKDLRRDNLLRKEGWIVYRITGKEMMNRNYIDWQSFEENNIDGEDKKISCIHEWLMNSGDGVIEAIKTIHFVDNHDHFYRSTMKERFLAYCHKTLEKHQLFD
jgi:hypothetical protein